MHGTTSVDSDSCAISETTVRLKQGNTVTRTTRRKSRNKKHLLALRHLLRRARLFRDYLYDYVRMSRHSSAVCNGDNREKLRALIIMRYHGIEKGLSLPSPRPGFGREKVAELIHMLNDYVAQHGLDYVAHTAVNALIAYEQFSGEDSLKDLCSEEELENLRSITTQAQGVSANFQAGALEVESRQLTDESRLSFEAFCRTRYSVRQFSDKEVAPELIQNAVRTAQKTPSVCNRQSSRVWIVSESDKIEQILQIGGGARGFDDHVKCLLIVTSDLSCFQSPGERNQCWIDGGMFAMSLLYALHAEGLGSCCMNWSKSRHDDLRLRRVMGISDPESIILIIGVGHLPERFAVARSARKPLSEVTRYW